MLAKFQLSPSTVIGLLTSITLTQIAGLGSLTMTMVWSGDVFDGFLVLLIFERNAKRFPF